MHLSIRQIEAYRLIEIGFFLWLLKIKNQLFRFVV